MKKGRLKQAMRPKNPSSQGNDVNSSPYDHDLRQRGHHNRVNHQQMYDKYMAQAREALADGDRVAAEYNYQCADHYLRVIRERQNYFNEQKNCVFNERKILLKKCPHLKINHFNLPKIRGFKRGAPQETLSMP